MADFQREDLENLSLKRQREEERQEKKEPRTPKQRALAWAALLVVLFGLAGTIYWMMKFTPGA